jgi:cytochrome c biogenesis protein CcmG/thiol:disulfide interchange protein DsbE
MARLKLFVPLIIVVAMGLMFFAVLMDEDYDPQALPSALIDKPLPAFDLPMLMQAGKISNDDLVGEVALLNVWATWCVSCRVEHPYLNQLAETQGLTIYGINYKDSSVDARRWLADLGNPYRRNIVDADGRLGLDLGVYGAPETYLIDKRGVIRFKHVGIVNERLWNEKLASIVQQLRGEGG